MENKKEKKSLAWLWILIAVVAVLGIGIWCGVNAKIAENPKTGTTDLSVFGLPALLAGIFIVTECA